MMKKSLRKRRNQKKKNLHKKMFLSQKNLLQFRKNNLKRKKNNRKQLKFLPLFKMFRKRNLNNLNLNKLRKSLNR